MFTRFARFDADVLEVKGSPVRQVTASLNKAGEYHDYRTNDDYMYVRIRAISSRVNKNHDGWPSVELAGSPDIFKRHQGAGGFVIEASEGNPEYGFRTFIGKPIFVDHNNSNPRKARGVIVDAKLRVLDQRTASEDKYWKSADVDREHLPPTEVELLLEVDSKQYPKFAKAIRNGDLDGFSMGANVEYTKCSHCGHIAHDPGEFCSHVLMKGAHHDYKTADGKRVSRKSYENCYKCAFFELSGVFEPADETALAREVISSIVHEGDIIPPTYDQPVPADPVRPAERDQEIERHALWLQHQYGYDAETALQLAQQKAEKDRPTPGHGEGEVYSPKAPAYAPVPMELERQRFEVPQDEGATGMPPIPQGNDPRWSSQKTAENPLPQSMLTRAPDEVDTLRTERICPVCGADMDGEQCQVCGYVAPPKEFDNPNLQKAQDVRQEMQQSDDQAAGITPNVGQPVAPGRGGPLTSQRPSKPGMTAAVTNDMRWTPKVHPKTAARINQVETPVRPSGQQTSNEPKDEVVLSDQNRPVTSAMLTARRLMETAKRNYTGDTMNTRTADGPTPPGDTSADKRVDVEGVGGVDQASNEEASRAQSQVDVTGIGGTGVQDVSADKSESLPSADPSSDDSGFNTDKTTEDSGPTKTYDDYDGEEPGVRDPVTSEPFPASEDGVKKTHQHQADAAADKPLEQQDQQGGSTNDLEKTPSKGTQPADPVGKAQDRVDLYQHTTSPANNSGPTTTWSGTDGNGVTRQVEPVTSDPTQFGGVKARVINAMRLADTELDLGLLDREAKWNRIDELSTADPHVVATRLATLQQVKTAGLNKLAQVKTTRTVPRAFGRTTAQAHEFERIASETEKPQEVDDSTLDSALFSR